ncbi:MAG TPA: hypothetical protein VMA36_11605 [Candidatus Limnocylindria bacterium]|jgi:hypothetical protein|nr:hypothetical protein [Candidatus Limnocylindria bacterium]
MSEAPRKTHWTDRYVDIASVALISLASVLTALCGYQSSLYATQRTQLFSSANVHRVTAASYAGRSNALEIIDVGLFVQYIAAGTTGDATLQRYIVEHLRPEMRPAMNAWLALKPGARPNSPLAMPEYKLATDADAQRETALAEGLFARAEEAGALSDRFVKATVTFATVSFLAAMSTKFFYPLHLVMIVLSAAIFLYGLVHIAQLRFI